MRNECNIIRDILPLYADKMVSADTASFVEEHLTGCAECRAELEKLKVTDAIESAVSDTENDDEKRLKAFAGKINRKRHIVISAFAAVLLLVVLLGGSLISSAKFGTANFFAAANGFVQVTAADREYVEIQRSPRVVVARPDYELFAEYMENRGFSEVEQFGSQHIFLTGRGQRESFIIKTRIFPNGFGIDTFAENRKKALLRGLTSDIIYNV